MYEQESPWTVDERTLRALRSDLIAVDTREMGPLLAGTADTIAVPSAETDRALLTLQLLDLYEAAACVLHEREAAVHCPCAIRCWTHVGWFVRWRDRDPRAAFSQAVHDLIDAFEHAHPPGPAQLASWAMRKEPARAWTVADLAATTGARPSHLRLDIQRRFGMRTSAYLHLIRAARALNLLAATSKVDAVAFEVGYRSKKDLYQTLARWTGATPTMLRALPLDERAWLERELRIRIVHGVSRRSEPGAETGSAPPPAARS